MRRLACTLLAATILAGCATADPDRWAWFCVIGHILYGAASFFTPVNETTMR